MKQMQKIHKTFTQLKNFCRKYKETKKHYSFTPIYRLAAVTQDSDGSYFATIQLINKNITFQTKPEEILADNNLVNQLSPTDVRALTYLGYLGINSPKYKILAKNLSTQDNSIIFTVRKKGEKQPLLKKASELAHNQEFLGSIDPKEAHMVGYTAGMEQTAKEEQLKQEAMTDLQNHHKDD
jgi:hypothetical protein